MTRTEGRILLVDDDAGVRRLMGEFLRGSGYEVETADTAEKGLARLAAFAPDLVLLDLSMPGMGGIGFLKRMAQAQAKTSASILVCTARANTEEFIRQLDVSGFVQKPCEPAKLLAEVERVLAEKRRAAGTAAAKARRTLLLVEDDELQGGRIARRLREAGFEVVTVRGGAEMLEKALTEKPDAVVIKRVLEGMNGDRAADLLAGMPSTARIPALLYDDTMPPSKGDAGRAGSSRRRLVAGGEPAELLRALREMFPG